jgi:hypothetical protein
VNISRAAFMKAFVCAGIGTCLDNATPIDAAAAGSATGVRLASLIGRGGLALVDARAAHFRPHVGDWFTVRTSANERYRVMLAEVTERPASRGVEQFSIIFHGAPRLGLAAGTHTFSHLRLGTLDLFISPIGPANRPRTEYQACFSRFATASRHQRT